MVLGHAAAHAYEMQRRTVQKHLVPPLGRPLKLVKGEGLFSIKNTAQGIRWLHPGELVMPLRLERPRFFPKRYGMAWHWHDIHIGKVPAKYRIKCDALLVLSGGDLGFIRLDGDWRRVFIELC